MRVSYQRTAYTLRGIHEFLQRQQVIVAMGDLKLPTERLEAMIDDLESFATDRETRARISQAGTGRIAALVREARFSYLRTVAKAARHLFPQDRALRESLQVRKGVRRPEDLVEVLRGMADAAAPHKAEFAKAGFADDFVQRMHAHADALKAAIDARNTEQVLRANAALSKLEAAKAGLSLIQIIDAMLTVPLTAFPPLLGEWRALLRRGRPRVSGGEPSSPAPSPVPPPASQPPASGAGAGASTTSTPGSSTTIPAAA